MSSKNNRDEILKEENQQRKGSSTISAKSSRDENKQEIVSFILPLKNVDDQILNKESQQTEDSVSMSPRNSKDQILNEENQQRGDSVSMSPRNSKDQILNEENQQRGESISMSPRNSKDQILNEESQQEKEATLMSPRNSGEQMLTDESQQGNASFTLPFKKCVYQMLTDECQQENFAFIMSLENSCDQMIRDECQEENFAFTMSLENSGDQILKEERQQRKELLNISSKNNKDEMLTQANNHGIVSFVLPLKNRGESITFSSENSEDQMLSEESQQGNSSLTLPLNNSADHMLTEESHQKKDSITLPLNNSGEQLLTEARQPSEDSIAMSSNNSRAQMITEENQQREDSITQADQQLNKPQKFKGPFMYDIELLENPLDNYLFLKRLRPEVRPQFLGEKQKYTFLKKFAIQQLQASLGQQISCLSFSNLCGQINNDGLDVKTTYEIFSWSLEEFMKRTCLPNLVWLQIILKSDKLCLQNFKFKKDMQELNKFCDYIFEGLLSHIDNHTIDKTEHVMQYISNIKLFLQYSHYIAQELHDNKQILKELDLIYYDMTENGRKRRTEEYLNTLLLQQIVSDNIVMSPIRMRWQKGWYETLGNQKRYAMEIAEEKKLNNITSLRNKLILECECNDNCMDFYYTSRENFQSSLKDLQSEFDDVVEDMENIINIKRMQLDKLRDQQKFLAKHLTWLLEKIEERRIIEEKEAADKALKLQQEQEELAAKKRLKQLRKSKKGKSRNKKSDVSPKPKK